MKKKKLTLDTLKVQSFLTSFDGYKAQTVKGGDYDSDDGNCTGGGGPTDDLNCVGGSYPPDCNPPKSVQLGCQPGTNPGPTEANTCQNSCGGTCNNCGTGHGCFESDFC